MNATELRKTVAKLPDIYLERYIQGFEAGTLAHGLGSQCAVGHMVAAGDVAGVYYEAIHKGEYRHVLRAVEGHFEGWDDESITRWMSGSGITQGVVMAENRRSLYDACIEELANRNSLKVEPATEAVLV